MPFATFQVKPGVNTIATPTLNQGGVSVSNLIRYRGGLIEKLGGWTRFVVGVMGSITRALHAWEDLNGNSWLAAGNLLSVNAITSSGSLNNITPQTLTTNPALNFSTSAGSIDVAVVDAGINNLTPFDTVFFNTPVSVGGLILAGAYFIQPGASGNDYTIVTQTPALSTVANGGAVPIFTTTLGSSGVSVNLPNHGLVTGGSFVFPIATLVGGLSILGRYSNIIVTDSSHFTIAAINQATSTQTLSMNGGAAQLLYSVVTGPGFTTSSGGLGPIGQFAIGQGFVQVTTISGQVGIPIKATDWTFGNWGEILLGCPRGGAIWYWGPSQGFSSMAPVGGPQFNNGIFVAMPAQILVAWGSTPTINTGATTDGSQNRLIVRWSDQLNFQQWSVNSLTQAGSFPIPTGSEIRGGIQGSGIALIFTDIDVWSMTYVGYPLIFGFNKIFSSAGLIGPHAVCEMRGAIYWMNDDNFYVCVNGIVSIIPCTVWDNVFQDLDTSNRSKCVAAPHPDFSEVFFFYPSISGGTGENDKYVKLNVAEGYIWDFGSMKRSAWQTRSVLGPPIGADPSTQLLQQHETSYSADGAVMNSFYESGYAAFGDGENFSVVDHYEPDMKYTTINSSTPSATVTVTLTTVNYPNDSVSMTETTTFSSSTEYATVRLRGRQAKWRIGTNDATSWWRSGNIRYRFGVDGRR